MRHYRTEAAKAMSGGLIFLILITKVAEDVAGMQLPKDGFALVLLVGACAMAAWLAEPRAP